MTQGGWQDLIPVTPDAEPAALGGVVVGALVVVVLVTLARELLRRSRLHRLLAEAHRDGRALEAQVDRRTAELAEVNATLAAEIAERRAAEARLRESEAQVRAMLDAAPVSMLVVRFPDGQVLSVNRPGREMLGLDAEPQAGLRTEDLVIDRDDWRQFLAQLREAGAVHGAEMRVRPRLGDPLWVLMSAERIRYRDVGALMICMIDISASKRLEETLRRAGMRAEAALEAGRRAMREQRNFLSMVSHEFRMPLAIIKGAAEVVGLYVGSCPEAQDELAKIGRGVHRLSDLIDVCLADDRLSSTELSLRVDGVDLGGVAHELCDEVRAFAPGRSLTVEADRPAPVLGDQALLRVALSNLVDNALKFSPSDAAVLVRIDVDPDLVTLRVIDQGPGISAEDMPRVFEKFFRSTRADRVRGAGLGLYLVRRIAELHHGGVAVESPPGQGATFALWLPRRRTGE